MRLNQSHGRFWRARRWYGYSVSRSDRRIGRANDMPQCVAGQHRVSEYSSGGATELQVALAPSGTALQTLTANVSNPTTPVSGLGDAAASTTSPVAVYVYRSSAPGITVIDQGTLLTLSEVEAIANAVIAG
jgi:hypothetical protein